jgi:hypothetical protein
VNNKNDIREALISYWKHNNFSNSLGPEEDVDFLLGWLWIEGYKIVPILEDLDGNDNTTDH